MIFTTTGTFRMLIPKGSSHLGRSKHPRESTYQLWSSKLKPHSVIMMSHFSDFDQFIVYIDEY